jgi:ATP-binding cassette, subfamily B, bacterial MsbA
MQPLLDQGFAGGELPLWLVPVVIIGLFTLRGVAGFVAQYGLAWAAQRAVLALRRELFGHLLASPAGAVHGQSASQLTNTIVYEVQQGTKLLVNAVLTLVKDSLTLLALLAYLMWLNWQLTLFVGLLFPLLALVMRTLGRRLHRSRSPARRPPTSSPTWSRRTCWPGASCACTAPSRHRRRVSSSATSGCGG